MLYKLKDRRGETLVETLASLLISAIAMLMFAQILSAAASVTKTGQSWNEDVSQRSNFLEERRSTDIPEGGSIQRGKITIAGLIEDIGDTQVKFYVTSYGGEAVISYGLVSSSS